MESRVNYTLIGLFVLLLGIAGIIIPLWLTSGLDQQQYKPYMLYMNEAVDGLSVNAPVKFNGVDVGYVTKITLSENNPRQVDILVKIKQGTPMTTHTLATLRERGITGVEYIGLEGGKLAGAQPLVAKSGAPYPVIAISPSLKARLDSAVKILMKNVDQVTQQVSLLVTPENTKLLHQSLQNMQDFTAMLNQEVPQMKQSVQSFNLLVDNLTQNSLMVPSILNSLQNTSQNIQGLSHQLQQNPSILLRGNPTLPLGPGEEQPPA